jgi:GxxExxY protein
MNELSEEINNLSYQIIGCAIEVHKILGPGLLESAYQKCLIFELKKAGFKVEKEISLPITYKSIELDHSYRIDILVNNQIVIELKTVEELTEVHKAQVLTYLKLGDFPLGLLINFNSKILKNNIKRYINT